MALGILAWAVAAIGLDRAFLQQLLATFIGAALGFLVALYIDRHQRSEEAATRRARDVAEAEAQRARDAEAAEVQRKRDAAAAEAQRSRDATEAELGRKRDAAAAQTQRELNAEVEQRARDREAAATAARRTTVLTLLRDELSRIPAQMTNRQERAYPPPNRLVDVFWRSLSSSGELRWIEDLELLRTVATAYDFVAVEADLERRWQEARALRGSGIAPSETFLANELKSLDRDTWSAVCRAYKAIDAALVRDGVAAGPEVFCP